MAHKVKMKITRIRQRVIQSREPVQRHHCQSCQREVEIVSNAQAIRILGVDSLTLGQLVANSQVHSVRTVTGEIWVCKESLFAKK